MEIKDLTGLSKPMTKLIEVCSSGLGKVAEPYLIKKRADAKAYELKTISKALIENKNLINLANTTYDSGNIEIVMNQDNQTKDSFQLMQNEILERQYFQEFKKQGNINNTINFTMHELENETEVSDEKVDEDWITRFFNTVENISNEQLQQLWAKILSGEIKQPNTYSLRTLEILKNLSFKEAELFSKIGAFAFIKNNDAMILADDKLLSEKFNINFSDLLSLQDLDLLHPNILQLSYEKVEKEAIANLIYGNQLIQINRDDKDPIISLKVHKFTTIGKELLKLIDIPFNKVYIQEIAKKIKVNSSIKVLYCPMIDNQKQYNPSTLVEI